MYFCSSQFGFRFLAPSPSVHVYIGCLITPSDILEPKITSKTKLEIKAEVYFLLVFVLDRLVDVQCLLVFVLDRLVDVQCFLVFVFGQTGRRSVFTSICFGQTG